MTTIKAVQLEVGDKIKYEHGEFTYIISEIKTSVKHKTRIVLVRINESNGQKKYSRRTSTDFIHEINDDGIVSEHWIQNIILINKNNSIPALEKIQII